MAERDNPVEFVADAALDYHRYRTSLPAGTQLQFDDSYRRAHLPLIAPDHPQVIAEDATRGYAMGVHRMIYSAVLPVPADALETSPHFRALAAALRAAPFAAKIAWDIVTARREKLHATVCGTLSVDSPPVISDGVRDALRAHGPFTVELRGLFSGNVNLGRLYFQLYPQARNGINVIHGVQQALGRTPTHLYLVGMYNFNDELTVAETAALQALLAQWQDQPLLRYVCDEIWILGSRDDLVLDSDIAELICLR
ncbi:MAG: hypothetical protein ACRCTD_01755 [Beijerinckiaceae bacterium]